jgi:hypothetical protein
MFKQLFAATALVALLAFIAAVAQAAPAATAEPMDLEVELLSKLALERAKARNMARPANQKGRAGTGLDGKSPGECGNVNIGNVITGGRPGFQPREVTVVITGDVINANNQCK